MNRTFTYLMVGGGEGSFIGPVHKTALDFLGTARMVGGCFSRTLSKSQQRAEEWGLDSDRVYSDFGTMLSVEAARPDKPDFVIIVTPNYAHFAPAKLALQHGFHVSSDKPLCSSYAEAEELVALACEKSLEFLVTYTYIGYPMMHQAREMVKNGDLGTIHLVAGEYLQGRQNRRPENWRNNKELNGGHFTISDIGTHIESLASFVTGLEVESLAARLDSFIPDRGFDDNAYVWLNYKGGAKGSYWASKVATGRENGLSLRVYGDKAGIEWEQENPNILKLIPLNGPVQILSRGQDYLYDGAKRYCRIPPGHPEGLFEAFANLYDAFLGSIVARGAGTEPGSDLWYPSVQDGARGMLFVEKALESSRKNNIWV